MEIKVLKSIEIRFVPIGKFVHPDRLPSLQFWGRVLDIQTGEEIGKGMHTHTYKHGTSFAANQKDFDQLFRVGSKIRFLVCQSFLTGKEYAMEKEQAIELADIRGAVPGIYGAFYLFYECDFTGESPF